MTADPRDTLREDLNREYYAIDARINDFDHRMLTVKGWSVTVSLAGLGLGFQQETPALFALASLGAVSFWLVEGLLKRQQIRYYPRLREIEVLAFQLNPVEVDHELASAPQANWWWWHARIGRPPTTSPLPHGPDQLPQSRRSAWFLAHVALPEALIAAVGLALFVLATTTGIL
ncbi:hypothetical protein [Nocardioides speluncae]|uniref:hypothetical protein n=1 Tax=Nocardioides speluncae TaxID=2670337 RepID=UPI0012B17D78|nr:hypothetical protein [Nocardioides speluncae]